jgi:AraC-like DNA-binding protein
MDLVYRPKSEREAHRAQASRDELVERMAQAIHEDGTVELLEGLQLRRASSHRIVEAIERLCKEFDQPLRIEDIARELGMSVSGFHHHFKAVTAMSPLQFQKQLRLQEARRLMLGEDLDAASGGYRVGYGDASHFTREYKRLFGAPPVRDVERLREATLASAGL